MTDLDCQCCLGSGRVEVVPVGGQHRPHGDRFRMNRDCPLCRPNRYPELLREKLEQTRNAAAVFASGLVVLIGLVIFHVLVHH